MQYYGKVQYNKLLQWSRNRGGKGGLGPPPPKLNKGGGGGGGSLPPISIILSCLKCTYYKLHHNETAKNMTS